MRLAATAVSVSLVLALAAPVSLAQTTTTTTAAPAAPAPTASAQRKICRQNVMAQNPTVADARVKMTACMQPVRENCRKQAAQQNVATGTPLKDFMRKCLST